MQLLSNMGIRTKIIGAMVVLLIFVALASYWVSYMHERKSLLTNMQDNAVTLNRALIVSVRNQKSIEEKVNLQTLVEELSLTEGVFGVWVVDDDSRITSATFREQVGEVASSRFVSEALDKGYYVSGFDKKMGEEVYTAVYPLKKGDQVSGLLEVAFELREYMRADPKDRTRLLGQMKADSRIMAESLSYSVKNMQDVNELIHIQNLVDRLRKGSEIISRIMIVDDNSRIIASSDLKSVGMIADDKGVRAIINGAEIYTRLFPRQKTYIVDMPLRIGDAFEGVVSVGYDATNYYVHLSEIFHFGLLISGMGIALCAFLSFSVANPIIMPIQRLTEVTKKLAGGDLSERATVNSNDEVGALAMAFNRMAGDLARSKEELDQYSKTLEEKVRQRTRELEMSNQELRTIQNELIEANMAKSEFLGIASHELRTPLTTLLGYSELMLTRPLSEDQKREFLGFINEESIRLSRIIDDLLDISRIESQKDFGFVLKPLQPADILSKNITFYAQSEIGHRIVTELEDDLPMISADGEKVGQVIKNLIDNAIRYSTGGDIVCKAFLKNDMVWISVRDHGMGISEEDLPRVFDKFFRVEREETAHIKGTGLGLSIAKYIVESHGGKMDLVSELGKGTMIGFGLPVAKDGEVS
ncbi:MAG: ATP-binding protein [Thermodesulfobacteriota bacterium]|nr:ATP-binding protein [Thermodesulfobacteriota bacterium]